ncbi:MAG: molybdopterin molybdotransferase MoeA [Syntrophobacterales bacterium]|nr:molybdopterin molybdotransferase MoeA [Syntrophobacterales bacterium]
MAPLEFFRLKTRDEVLALYVRFAPTAAETVPLAEAWGRVLARDLAAPESLPAFPRAGMDGYAVRAQDTFGASPGLPQYLELVGEVAMGEAPTLEVGPGQAARLPTGGMLPAGADAVLMVEYAAELPDGTVEVRRPVAPGENVVQPGEDVRAGEVLLAAGRRLRPQDLGLLAALGVTEVPVHRRPRVAVLSSGNEIVPLEAHPRPGQVRDANAYLTLAQVEEAGGVATYSGIVPDDAAALRTALGAALPGADLVILSGGSSVGARDLSLGAIAALPEAEVLVHGVAIRPGKPTILAVVEGKPLLGLPGHPASAAIVMQVLGRPLVARLGGVRESPSKGGRVLARLSRNLAGATGREDFVRVRLRPEGDTLWADPLLGASALLSPLVKSDGLVTIPLGQEGIFQGELVEVELFPG